MTWAEELIREGRQEGRQEGVRLGELKERRAVLVRMLSSRFELGDSQRDLIEACEDPAALDEALDEFARGSDTATILARLRR